jgi:outer membrane protein OmpA-like peptidoglycan-associated protein
MAFAQTEGTETDANADLLNHIDDILDEEIPDLVAMGRGERQGPWEDVGDIERNIDHELQTGGQWDGNQITSNDNPLLTETCHEDAMRAALHEMMERKDLDQNGAVEMARMHMGERQAAFREGGTTYSEYIEHIASCKAFCGPMVKKLIGCHVLAVKSLEHDMVFFPFDSYEVNDLRSQEAIGRIGRSIRQDPTKSVLLIGRASRIGPLGYNRRLSGLRARAVGEQLNDLGIAQDRIQTLTFGWEPPQIDARIADAYNLADLYSAAGKNRTNQSVIMVVY